MLWRADIPIFSLGLVTDHVSELHDVDTSASDANTFPATAMIQYIRQTSSEAIPPAIKAGIHPERQGISQITKP